MKQARINTAKVVRFQPQYGTLPGFRLASCIIQTRPSRNTVRFWKQLTIEPLSTKLQQDSYSKPKYTDCLLKYYIKIKTKHNIENSQDKSQVYVPYQKPGKSHLK